MFATHIISPDIAAVSRSAQTGTMEVAVRDGGVVEVTGVGRWSQSHTDRHFTHLGHVIDRVRRGQGTARVLVDLRQFAIQPPEVTERIRHWAASIYGKRDRVAILVASSVVKAQLRQLAMNATRELFLSEPAARLWLMA